MTKMHRTARELRSISDLRYARRTEPTPAQAERAIRQWGSSVLSRWMASRQVQPTTAR